MSTLLIIILLLLVLGGLPQVGYARDYTWSGSLGLILIILIILAALGRI